MKKVIIADDNSEFAVSFAKKVFDNEVEITYVSNAEELVDAVKKDKYSLIVTDNRMEDGHEDSGIYAIGKIREFNIYTPIVFHTSAMDFAIAIQALNKGANDAISKYIDLSEIKKVIKKYL